MFKVAITLVDKWWKMPFDKVIKFFCSKLNKLSAKTEIEREYSMVTLKIIDSIIAI